MHADRFLNESEVCKMIGVRRSTVRRMIAASSFPRPYRLSPNRVGWLESEVLAWISSRPRA